LPTADNNSKNNIAFTNIQPYTKKHTDIVKVATTIKVQEWYNYTKTIMGYTL
jgi:hypothetical protein